MFLIVVVLLAIAVYLILRVAIPKFKLVQEKLDKVNTVNAGMSCRDSRG